MITTVLGFCDVCGADDVEVVCHCPQLRFEYICLPCLGIEEKKIEAGKDEELGIGLS